LRLFAAFCHCASTALAFSAHSLMQQLGKNPQAASPTAPCFEIALCTPVG
jgi:hypothetical protein